MERVFWLLWNPNGQRPPTHRFDNYEEAAKVAEEMQKRIGIGVMYVLKAEQSYAVSQKGKWEGLK